MYDPERYEANRSGAARDSSVFVRRMISEMTWTRNELILDYGCGPGSTGAELILPVAEATDSKVLAVDISEEMVQFASKNFKNPRVTYAVGNILDGDDFPFNDIKVDKIFSIYVLHLTRDYKQILKRFHDLLNPGGHLGFTVVNSKMFLINKKLVMNPKWTKYLNDYEKFLPDWINNSHGPEDLKESFQVALKRVGFQIISLEVLPREFVFSNFETLIEAHLSLNPFLKSIPEHLQSDFKEEHRNFLIDHCNMELDGKSAKINYDALYAVAKM